MRPCHEIYFDPPSWEDPPSINALGYTPVKAKDGQLSSIGKHIPHGDAWCMACDVKRLTLELLICLHVGFSRFRLRLMIKLAPFGAKFKPCVTGSKKAHRG